MVEDDQAAGSSNLGGYDEMVLTKNTETIDAFSSCVITTKAGKLIPARGSMWWLRLYVLRTVPYHGA